MTIVSAQFYDARIPPARWRRVDPCPATGCWLWTGKTATNGYGVIQGSIGKGCAHRYFYSTLIGPVQRGLNLDHLCRVRCCVNPLHLEPVTRSENLRRGANGDVIRARMALRTSCPSGHPYDSGNTYRRPGAVSRDCLTCRRARSDAYNKRVAAEVRK
jgi:hypothetical protein